MSPNLSSWFNRPPYRIVYPEARTARKRTRYKTLAVVVVSLVLVGSFAGTGYSFFTAKGEASQRFKVGDAGKIDMSIDNIDPKLLPGVSAPVTINLQNVGEWSVRVQSIALASITDLPDNCPPNAFGFKAIAVHKTLTADEKLSVEGVLKMDNDAPNPCAGADPLLTLEVS